MKRILRFLRLATVVVMWTNASWVHADRMTRQQEAFNAGKDFANTGKIVAGNQINSETGQQHIPHYRADAPESAHYQEGKSLTGGIGTQKQIACQTYRAPNGLSQQECDAVNFLSQNATPNPSPKYPTDKHRDPLITASKRIIEGPSAVPGVPKHHCRVDRTGKTVCDTALFCQEEGAGCFDTRSVPDQDFGRAIVMMEAAREAGVYGVNPNKVEILKGYQEACSKKVLGRSTLKNCCKASGSGEQFSNYALLGAGVASAGSASRETVRMGSKYVYDALYHSLDSSLTDKGLSAMNSWAGSLGDGVANPHFGLYGFTFNFSLANGFQFAGFDPYSFGVSVGVMLAKEWLSCDQSEQRTSLKRGKNLCVHLETYCKKRVMGICVEKKERHCCFNSKLAKLMNRQGRTQLGLPMNSCEGFTQSQLQSLDFSRMDLSEFIADIVPKEVNVSDLSDKVRKSVEQRVQNYYSQ